MAPKSQKRPENNEDLLLEQGRRIRALHMIISRPDLSFDQQIDETLRLGCRLLGTEIGKVGRQDPENNISEFLNVVVMSDLPAKRGAVIPLDKTFCQITFSSPQTIAISHVAESEYQNHPAAGFLGMQSYIGTSINVFGKKFGTINFSNRKPVAKPFTEADKDLVNLMGSWISVMMERQLEAEELKKSKQTADAANQAKSTFLANMSHEIRTPLTSIIGFAELAVDEDQTTEQRVEALQTIRQSGNHLLNLINDILDFSKIEAGEMDIEKNEIHPLELASEIESMVQGQAKKKGLDFTIQYNFPLPEKIISDPLRLKQILLNLCSNAIKFTDSGSIQLSLKYDEKTAALEFSVRDTGIGMTSEQVDNLFKAFKQADTSISRRFGGTGLGLFLSKRLAELLGSTLEVESQSGEGSIFKLTLSNIHDGLKTLNLINSTEQIRQASPTQLTGAMLAGDVLVAEDNQVNQKLIKMYLESIGFTVTIVNNGAEAVNAAQQRTYDIIYMDMQMPILSGIDAVRTLRNNNYHGPIIMLTANAASEDRKLCVDAGSDDYLTKPIFREKLYQVSKKYLK